MKKILFFLLSFFCVLNIYSEEKIPLVIGMIEGSEYYYQEISEYDDYNIPLKPVKEDEFEKIQKVSGKIIRTIFIHPAESSYSIYTSYLKELKKQGYNLLFQVEKDGGGNKFKNKIYALNPVETDNNYECSIPFNSGSDTNQYYIAAVKKLADREIYVTININTGWWNYPVYRIDIIETEVEIPEVKTIAQITEKLLEKGRIEFYNIKFEQSNDKINQASLNTLNLIGEYILKNSDKTFYIAGHTDNSYDFEQSMAISKKRAQAVLNYLTENFDLSEVTISSHGLGQLCPVFSNSTGNGKKFNERVELVIK